MGMVVRTNVNALNSHRNLNKNNKTNSKSLEKLASGYKINRAADDAAGLSISEKMTRSDMPGNPAKRCFSLPEGASCNID